MTRDGLEQILKDNMVFMKKAAAKLVAGTQFDPDEIVQQTCIRAMNNCEKFNGDYPKAWLQKILYRLFINEWQRNKRQQIAIENYRNHPRQTATAALSDSTALRDSLETAIGQLQNERKEVARMYFLNGDTYQDIADKTGCPIGTVMSRIFRARKDLRVLLKDVAQELGIPVEKGGEEI